MGKTEELSTASLGEKDDFLVPSALLNGFRGAATQIFCAAEDSVPNSNLFSASRNKRSRRLEAQRMFTSDSAEDVRIPNSSTPSIDANDSNLVANYLLLFHVGRSCAFCE
jgi:hypothetical protein